MSSAVWAGCGLVGKCHHQRRRPGQKISGALPCDCSQTDSRIGKKAKHGAPDRPGQRAGRMADRLGGIQTELHAARGALQAARHLWLWTGKRYLHLEPAGQREIAPGRSVPFRGKTLGGRLPGWQLTPLPPHGLVHAPPVPRSKRPQILPAHHQQRAGHYGWSPILHHYAWIGSHQNLSLDPSQLPPKLRHAVTSAIKSTLGHTHAHVAWGVTGHRVYVIPGHWHWNKASRTWTYVERHTDQLGKLQTHVYPQSRAPSAAFGARPPHIPPLHFWPDHTGTFRNAHGSTPADAATTVTIPAHARYAKANGLLDPAATTPNYAATIGALAHRGFIGAVRTGRAAERYREQQAAKALTTSPF